ncbi:serine hydrolase [Goodfellowiella coeruleoviolacea]|uniref:Beta-lactamase n=1 Tax=Goodfellowiella coeruleoviolacea TaxID=334858 RepID=A0AAE3GBV1_9PSEU|nr:serine hydrolase [Goodfellowiella coeruleoviolacea]MCP2165265.1 Beta-lactamase enzyme family protein [Goodfellowiella coeruleoviolacea]
MRLSRRRLLAATAAAGSATLLGPTLLGHAPVAAAAPPAPDTGTEQGWLDWLRRHRDHAAVVVDNGSGGRIAHRATADHVLASTIKVVHLAGYATAVTEGRLDPDQQVRVGDWEAYYPGFDGGAHGHALAALGVPNNGVVATDPEHRVSVDQLAHAMITYSDNAATDYLRDLLGDPVLRRAAHRAGWRDPDLRSLLGEVILLILPERAPRPGAPASVRRAVGDRLARQAMSDPDLQRELTERVSQVPDYTGQLPWARQHGKGSARDLAAIHSALASGSFTPHGAVPVARDHLERQARENGPLPPGVLGIGFKGGSLPGVLNLAYSVRWADGRVGVGVVLVDGIDQDTQADAMPLALLIQHALADPAWLDRLATALTG